MTRPRLSPPTRLPQAPAVRHSIQCLFEHPLDFIRVLHLGKILWKRSPPLFNPFTPMSDQFEISLAVSRVSQYRTTEWKELWAFIVTEMNDSHYLTYTLYIYL